MALSEVNKPHCLVCGSEAALERYRAARFRVLVCRGCEQVFLDPLPSPKQIRELFEALYSTGDGSVPELKEYYGFCFADQPSNPLVQQYERWLERIEVVRDPGRVLDVGCGTGLFLSVARRRGWQPFGIDESVEATNCARDHFGLEPWVGEFGVFADQGQHFDLITGWDVIEHARDPVGLLRCVRRCLAPGGIVGLSTPNQRSILYQMAGLLYRATGGRLTRPLETVYLEQHFLYFTPRSLRHCLELAGLEISLLERELTDLRRLSLSPAARLALESLFLSARLFGRGNRLFAICRAGRDGQR